LGGWFGLLDALAAASPQPECQSRDNPGNLCIRNPAERGASRALYGGAENRVRCAWLACGRNTRR